MPYDPSRSAADQPADQPETDEGETGTVEQRNPFLQFVDPSAHQQLVERIRINAQTGRLITPLSRVQNRKGGANGLDGAWDEELADDAV
jgi:hypothetical protein